MPTEAPSCRSPSARAAASALVRLACLVLLLQAGVALAEATPYYVGGSIRLGRESAVVQTPLGAEFSRADTGTTTTLAAGFDQPFGRQRGYANLSLNSTRFASDTSFNNQSYSVAGGLDWSTVENVSGSLSASTNRTLLPPVSAAFGQLGERVLQTISAVNANASIGLVGPYSLTLGASRQQVRADTDLATVAQRDADQEAYSIGLKWRPRGATTVVFDLSTSTSRFPRALQAADGSFSEDSYRQDGAQVSLSMQPTGNSLVEARIGQYNTRYTASQQRDSSAIAGSLFWRWTPLAKSALSVRLSHDTDQRTDLSVQQFTPTFFTQTRADRRNKTEALLLGLSHDYSAKVSIGASARVARSDSVQIIDNQFFPTNASDRDHSRTLSLNARWTPTRGSALSCEYTHDRHRGQLVLVNDSTTRALACTAQITFQ